MAKQVKDRASSVLPERLSERGNVLVLGSTFGNAGVDICTDLLAAESPGETTVIAVTYRQSAHEWIERWDAHVATPPARGVVVGVGDDGDDSSDLDVVGSDRWTAKSVDNAGDLTGLGICLSDLLDGATGRTRFCFDSLTALLQYSDLKPAFQFCHALAGRVKSADAVGHYHLDPAAHDEQTLATVMSLFDASIERDGDGLTVRTR